MDDMQSEEQRKGKVLSGIIGFGSNQITHRMKALISALDMPLIVYREQWKEFILKDSYQNLMSIGWNILHFTLFSGYMFQKIWNYIILITDSNLLVDYDYYFGHTLLEFAPMHGYQWTATETVGKQFDWEDEHPYCAMKPTCTEAFEGMDITYSIHNLSGYSTPLWYHVSGAIALGYDAVLSFLEFEGLTGVVRYSKEGGWRMGSINGGVNIVSFKKLSSSRYTNYYTRNLIRWMRISDYHESFMQKLTTLRQVVEIPIKTSEIQREIYKIYLSTRGYLSYDAKFISHSETKNLDHICLRTEIITAAYYCNESCGGGRIYSDNATEFKHGVCVFPNECRCRAVGEIYLKTANENAQKIGYTGQFCQSKMLNQFFDCSAGCVHGTCTEPHFCKCDIGYYGTSCSTLLGVIVGGCLKAIEYQLRNLDWLVNWKDVRQTHVVLSGLVTPLTPTPKTVEIKANTNMYVQRMENTVQWKDNICYVKKFNCDTLDINYLPFRKEIISLREIRHPNLVRFIGACLVAPNVGLLLELVPKVEYLPKPIPFVYTFALQGSLFEILTSGAYKLTWNFKLSILKDIAMGMEYLHNSNTHSHGHLTSRNCLIDNRWTCKVTECSFHTKLSGFGVPSMRNIMFSVEDLVTKQHLVLWTAPEILRKCATFNEIGVSTKSGDVYSFGIIVTEMCTHKPPFYYELEILSIEELIRLLKNFHDSANRGIKGLLDSHNYDTYKPIRPNIINSRMPDSYAEKRGIQDLITLTTAEDAFLRPSFSMLILEKYTYHLQEIFAEKVWEVQTEKNKTEELLDRILPQSIAEKMALNREILPVKYLNVTIFYSDIVGFTTIAKESQPMEVVELLNDLYTCFDSIIEKFDVYKLETIGDAYCVTSGVPTPSFIHAQEIATMGLYILSAVNNFPIRHMPEKKLQIRIGIHSGSCVAGVIGMKMPRFCIFGSDVIIAQHMESSGLPNAIQVSEATAKILGNMGIFYLVYRGEIEIQFVGKLTTYWLIGKDGLDLEVMIPQETRAQSESVGSSARSSWGYAAKHRRKSILQGEKMSDIKLDEIIKTEEDVFITDDFESSVSENESEKDKTVDAKSTKSKSISLLSHATGNEE
uniref:guanylate cyclase n=1 Tax=Strigamia maritima TaxID=126957 RepID=T1IT78_STRMM